MQVPTEHMLNGSHLSAGSRKAAKRTLPWDLTEDEIQLALPRPQDEDDDSIRETKRRRLEDPSPASTDEDTTVALTPQATDHADSDPVMHMHPNAMAAGTPRRWTPEEDTKLTSAITNTCIKKMGKERRKDWVAVAALVPSRTKEQCCSRWHNLSLSKIDPTTARAGEWTADEDKKLKEAVGAHGGKNWGAIVALVPGRTNRQCRNRWYDTLVCNINPTTAPMGHWTADEIRNLKDAVGAHGTKNWEKIAVLVPGRTKSQCSSRWYNTLVSKIEPTTARAGKWTADEDKKLKDAVRAHGGKNWEAIAALIPGRTKSQCSGRWHVTLVCNINPTTARAGEWTADEDKKLKDAVGAHGTKNWEKIAVLVPGRTKSQCSSRWYNTLVSKIDPTTARAGKWTADENKKLNDAVRAHGGKNWKAIAALIPGRSKKQCSNRWHVILVSNIDPTRKE